MDQHQFPLFSALQDFHKKEPISFHVPGHKNGHIFSKQAKDYYRNLLKLDVTELDGLDDLHAPNGVIQDAEHLAAEFFQADHTFFLVNGSTAGNLAMVLATVQAGDKVLVQRNCHKSVMHAVELAGAIPIFLSPQYDEEVNRFTSPRFETLQDALSKHPDAKAVILTYPDYFGRTYDIHSMIEFIHTYQIPVLVDEAHGVHFSLGSPFPTSSLQLGADVVVQSAHKTAPAMTQSSYLHVKSEYALKDRIAYYLQMIQSSSPSYPLMASLDLARGYLATRTRTDIKEILHSVTSVRKILETCKIFEVLPLKKVDDVLKITLQVKQGFSIQEVINLFQAYSIYPELHTEHQILLVHGLGVMTSSELERLEKALEAMNEKLKKGQIHATIDISKLFPQAHTELALTYQEMSQLTYINVPFDRGIGKVAAESIIPYPPGIPLILKGEKITESQIGTIHQLLQQGVRIQQRDRGIKVFNG